MQPPRKPATLQVHHRISTTLPLKKAAFVNIYKPPFLKRSELLPPAPKTRHKATGNNKEFHPPFRCIACNYVFLTSCGHCCAHVVCLVSPLRFSLLLKPRGISTASLHTWGEATDHKMHFPNRRRGLHLLLASSQVTNSSCPPRSIVDAVDVPHLCKAGFTRRIRSRSIRAPKACPITAAVMVNSTAYRGMMHALRREITNGSEACTARNQARENFSVCSLHIPSGTLTTVPAPATAKILNGTCLGLRFFTASVLANAALSLTMGVGQLSLCGCVVSCSSPPMAALSPGTLAMGHLA